MNTENLHASEFNKIAENIENIENIDTPHDPRMRVLVVDDEPVIVDVISELLGDAYIVDKAYTVHEAYGLLDAKSYDVLLTDYNMPGMSGTMLGKIAKEKHGGCKVVIITGSDETEAIRSEGSSDAIVRKPVRWSSFMSIMNGFSETRSSKAKP